ncbi:Uncharacterised protein [Streptococcus equi subsp. zooepidemicus]|nr:Uncharacterised protein [Streptococcus equi subsp. zooepidemicus]
MEPSAHKEGISAFEAIKTAFSYLLWVLEMHLIGVNGFRITIQDASTTFQDLNTESNCLSAILGLSVAADKK